MARKKRKNKVKLSADEKKRVKLVSDHKRLVRSVFRSAGFRRFPHLADKEFQIDVTASDFDDIYVYENIVLCIEYTTASDVGDHLKKKKIVYDKIDQNQSKFLQVLAKIDNSFNDFIQSNYNIDEFIIKYIYCSRHSFNKKHEHEVPNPVYLNYPELRYFKAVTDCIKISAFPELIQFLGIEIDKVGKNGVVGAELNADQFSGSLLPEANSNFDPGFKVVSFYVSPDALLSRAYVLRKQGWRHTENPYQRMIVKSKIDNIRGYLKNNKRVFVNNVIATLDSDTKIINDKGDTVDPKTITTTQPVMVQIPNRMNTVGLIDGQHRTFSYYKGSPDDDEIMKLRKRQNLLVTGIIYPDSIPDEEKEKFEARLFLEINSTQTNAKSDLKQAINLILKPFSDESIATKILDELDRSSGPLSGLIQRYWFDTDKLKTTSIISYAMRPLVKTFGNDSLFNKWDNQDKNKMVEEKDHDLLNEYIKFCVHEINNILIPIKKELTGAVWSANRKEGGFLTTTTVNCFLICLRLLIEKQKTGNQKYYEQQFLGLKKSDFEGFHSSRYRKMAEAIVAKYFPN